MVQELTSLLVLVVLDQHSLQKAMQAAIVYLVELLLIQVAAAAAGTDQQQMPAAQAAVDQMAVAEVQEKDI
tara:strand:- start:376 stop:588 length:213 start_codon:yes stop_codon:yes gene_type:complete